MNKLSLITAVVASFISFAIGTAQSADVASTDDTARFLAGMPPSADSPLVPLTQDRSWQQHAKAMDKAFAEIDRRQVSRIKAWGTENLTAPQPIMFYMFSGPDFLYADAFFPRATTYVLSALEPTGLIPDLLKTQHGSILLTLASLQHSMQSLLAYSFFITHKMRNDLQAQGTLPLLYVFLARSGKKIRDVSLVNIDSQGELQTESGPKVKSTARGVKIVFADADGREKTLYYFNTDLSNSGVKKSGFLTFCDKLGDGDSLVKSASYLMHRNEFSQIRDFLLSKSAVLLQDDSGIPLRYFDVNKRDLTPFGNYLTPDPVFANEPVYQPNMKEFFRKAQAKPIDFGVGYRWRPGESNLLLAVRRASADNPAENKWAPQPAETSSSRGTRTKRLPPCSSFAFWQSRKGCT
jgi:hypothetical protein